MPNDEIVSIIGVVMTICGGAALFIAGSTSAMAESGIASVNTCSGSETASRERANPAGLTAAHRTLAFGAHRARDQPAQQEQRHCADDDHGIFVQGRVIDVTPGGERAP